MVSGLMAYRASDQVEPATFHTDDYFSARLLIARAKEIPDKDGRSVYSLEFINLGEDRFLPPNLGYTFTDKGGSFKGEMGVSNTRQLRGRKVAVVFRRSDQGIEAIIPSNEVL